MLQRGDGLAPRLASSRTWPEVAEMLWAAAREIDGAVATGLAMPGSDGSRLDFLPSAGRDREPAERWTPVPFADDHPVAEVARTGGPLFFDDPDAFVRRYPDLLPARSATGDQAWAILPVTGPLLATPGVLTVAWAVPRAFDRGDRAALTMIGRFCATVLSGVPARARPDGSSYP